MLLSVGALSNNLLNANTADNKISNLFINFFAKLSSPIVYESKRDSTAGPEMGLIPVSQKALTIYKFELQKLLHNVDFFGGLDKERGAGLHIHFDSSLFGDNEEKVKKGLSNYVLLNYYMNDLIKTISQRTILDEFKTDFILNVFGTGDVSALQMKNKLINTKIDMLDYYNRKENTRRIQSNQNVYGHFNHIIASKAPNLIEARIYVSRTQVDCLMAMLEYQFCSAAFSQERVFNFKAISLDDENKNIEEFLKYIETNSNLYPHLYNFLKDSEYSSYLTKNKEEIFKVTNEQLFNPNFYDEVVAPNMEAICTFPQDKTSVTVSNDSQEDVLVDVVPISELNEDEDDDDDDWDDDDNDEDNWNTDDDYNENCDCDDCVAERERRMQE
jgi:hypothetical protein